MISTNIGRHLSYAKKRSIFAPGVVHASSDCHNLIKSTIMIRFRVAVARRVRLSFELGWKTRLGILVVLAGISFLTGCSRPATSKSSSPAISAPLPVSASARPPTPASPVAMSPTAAPATGRGAYYHKPLPFKIANIEPDDEDALDVSISKLRQGNLVYSTPTNMKAGRTGHVTARIGDAAVSVGSLKSGLQSGTGTAVAIAQTPISPAMKMILTSADFSITALSSEEQIVGGPPTNWEWDILPKHSGKLRLHLAAVVVLNNISRDFTTIDRDIFVQVDPVGAAESFIAGNWQWLIATLTAMVGALLKYLKSRKKADVA